MRRRLLKRIIALLIVTISLTVLSCAHEKTTRQEPANTMLGHEDYLKGVRESKKIIVAKVNGADITLKELVDRMNQITPRYVKNP